MLSFLVGTAFAQSPKSLETVSGAIHNDTTWTNDTVYVTGDIFVPDTVTLTINAGTAVLFDNQYCINIQGCIIAQGAINDSITFTAADTSGFHDTTHIGWSGLRFDSLSLSVDTSIISFCKFLYFYNDSVDTAAIYINDFSKIIIENSRFSHNIHNGFNNWPIYTSSPSCIQIENESSVHVLHNIFTYNYGSYGSINLGCSEEYDIVDVLIKGNIFRYNIGGEECSSLKLSGYNQALVVNNIFEYNYSEYSGGAICISGFARPTLIGNLIANNYAEDKGGAFTVKYYAAPKIINNTIVQNYSKEDGGAFSVGCHTLTLLVQNNIIWGNVAEGDGEQIYIYDDEYLTPSYTISNNIIQGGFDSIYVYNSYAGTFINNIDTSPAFVDSVNHDYHLTCASPALDAGSNPMIPQIPLFDIDGNYRISGAQIDLGAFELAAAYITNQPQNITVNPRDQAVFSVTASGATSYQWETSNDFGNTWYNVVDGANFSGATTNTLTINTYNSLNGHLYRCILTSNCPNQIIESDYAILLVNVVNIEEMQANFSIYPNPFSSKIYLENAINTEVFITDVNGKLIQHIANVASDKESIDLSKQSNGVYFVKIIEENTVKTRKIIKK